MENTDLHAGENLPAGEIIRCNDMEDLVMNKTI